MGSEPPSIGVDCGATMARVPVILAALSENGSRRRRIASGSGTSVQEINRLLKQYQDMADMMKKMKKLGPKGLSRHGLAGLLPGGLRH